MVGFWQWVYCIIMKIFDNHLLGMNGIYFFWKRSLYGGFLNEGTPKWMVCNWKSYWNGWFRGTSILGNLYILMWHTSIIVGLRTPAMPQGLWLLPRMSPIWLVVSLQPSAYTVFLLHSCSSQKSSNSWCFHFFWNHQSPKKHRKYRLIGASEAKQHDIYNAFCPSEQTSRDL